MLTQSKQPKFSYLRRIMILPLGAVIFASLSFVVDRSDIAELKAAFTPSAIKETAVLPEQPATPEVKPAFSSTSIQLNTAEEDKSIDGIVLSNGAPVKNATVLIKGTRRGTITDENGGFELTEMPDNAVIAVSCVGYRSTELAVKQAGYGKTNVLVQLHRDNQPMNEIVVVGYGTEPDTTPESPVRKKDTNNEIFTFVEQPPVFPGGQDALNKYLAQRIRYPQAAVKGNVEGTVFVTFVVDQDGTISDVRTMGKAKGAGLEEEATRVVKGMPQWQPGKQNGQTVSVQFSLPIRFALQREKKAATPAKQTNTTLAQPAAGNDEVFTQVEKVPAFPGGTQALYNYLSKTVKYPKDAVEHGKKGTVMVTFIVRPNGQLTDIESKGEKLGYGLDEEAVRTIKSMPKWKPGEQNGQAVACRYDLPIRFSLQN